MKVYWRELFLSLVLSFLAILCHSQSVEEQFNKGVKALNSGQPEIAIQVFENLLQNDFHSVAIYNNLGAAYFQINRQGPAIYNYELGLLLDPDNNQIRQNLALIYPENSVVGWKGVWIRFLGLNFSLGIDTWAAIGIGFVLIGSIMFTFTLFRIRKIKAGLIVLMYILGLYSFIAASFQYFTKYMSNRALIMSPNVNVKSAASFNSKDVLEIPEGEIVKILDTFEDWHKIKLVDNTKGWIEKKSVSKIRIN